VDIILVRLLFVLVVAVTCFEIGPFGLSPVGDAGVGGLIGAAIVVFEWKLRSVSLKRLIGAAIGSFLGICGAYLFALVIRNSVPPGNTQSFLQILVMLLMAYVGLIVGANKGDLLNLAALGGIFGGEKQGKKSYKILDTSVIIDGRIADIAETGFLDGIIVTPQFVLRELQLVADSADSLKRNRGRRGLDILQRLQKVATLTIQIVEDDFPAVREVDLKLIELAKLYEGKIITNDFNLNKVAQLQGVEVLNINELANSLKPIVLPGETMRVFILKEGKEYNQGVAYLDDGTMVVVDNARKMIGKTIDVSVTSVLQTTAGKMIFGKWDERAADSRSSRSLGRVRTGSAVPAESRPRGWSGGAGRCGGWHHCGGSHRRRSNRSRRPESWRDQRRRPRLGPGGSWRPSHRGRGRGRPGGRPARRGRPGHWPPPPRWPRDQMADVKFLVGDISSPSPPMPL
jgi:uncharacterized protein YacL